MGKTQALYSRVSTDIQRERGFSIPRQKGWLEEEAKRHNFRNIRHYTDEGYSATDFNRPEFKRLLTDIEDGLVETVIVYKYDRIARRVKDLICFLELLNGHNINFISITERFDTTTPMGKAMLMMTGTFAQLERETTVERVKDAMWDKAKKGTFCGGQPPYGYDIKDKRPVINKNQAQIVKDIYNKFEELHSYRGVTVWLNSMSYKTKQGKTWASSTVRRILTNIFYTGYYTYGKRANGSTVYLPQKKWLVIKGNFDPVISQEQFDGVNAIIRQRKFAFPKRKYGEVYILSGIMKCECGGSLNGYTITKKTSGKKYCYYKCHNNTSKGKGVCTGNTLRKDEIEAYVLEEIRKQSKLHFEESEAQKVLEKKEKDSPREHLKRVEAYISKLKSKQEKVIELFEDGAIPKGLLVKRMDKLTTELEKVENQRQNLKAEISPKQKSKRVSLLQKINRLNGDFLSLSDKAKRDILRQLVKQITVKRAGEVEIELYEL